MQHVTLVTAGRQSSPKKLKLSKVPSDFLALVPFIHTPLGLVRQGVDSISHNTPPIAYKYPHVTSANEITQKHTLRYRPTPSRYPWPEPCALESLRPG